MSGWFPCHDSGTSISQNYVCNGRYECDSYEDEKPCDRSPTNIREDESYAISNLDLYEREYHVFVLQTNSSYGFQIKFQHVFLNCCGMRVQIGTGTDPFDDRSVVKAIEDDTNYVDDVFVRTSHMWLVMAGGKYSNVGHVDIIVTAILVSAGSEKPPSYSAATGGQVHKTPKPNRCIDTMGHVRCIIFVWNPIG
ncbi:uncharacterized protein LOC115928487 [Strongylocentrotus purpuratus]|uniref:Uncharacterized protein n=1 Tax=Strongylocentrotus purpuratus TaxID=7668 RepID=A0A7M7PIF5_STRPU|nr:uncharacterized protein LOC115928487 [Strongylocentrotus purpuratus]